MIIDCEQCVMYKSSHCKDCFVTSVISKKSDLVQLDEEQELAVAALQDAGLAPVLRFQKREVKKAV